MRYLLAPFMLLLVAACSTISIGAVAALRGVDPLTADPAQFQLVSSSPQTVQLDPAGQKLTLSATRGETGQRIEEQFILDRLAIGSSSLRGIKPAEGENLYLYQMAQQDLDRYMRMQTELQSWKTGSVRDKNNLSLGVQASGCIVAGTSKEDRLATFWLSVDQGDSFMPLVKNVDLVDIAREAGLSENIQTC